MGMAASQGRLLSMTARLSDVEFSSQQKCQSKIKLAMSTEELTRGYSDALNQTKLVGVTGYNGSSPIYTDMTYDLLTGPNSPLTNQFCLSDSNNNVIVSNKMAENFQGHSLEDFLKSYDALGTTSIEEGTTTYPAAYPDEASYGAELTRLQGVESAAKTTLDGTKETLPGLTQAEIDTKKSTSYGDWQRAYCDADKLKPKASTGLAADAVKTIGEQMAILSSQEYTRHNLCGSPLWDQAKKDEMYNNMIGTAEKPGPLMLIKDSLTAQAKTINTKITALKGADKEIPATDSRYAQYSVYKKELDTVNRMSNDIKNVITCMDKFKSTNGAPGEIYFAVANDILFGHGTDDSIVNSYGKAYEKAAQGLKSSLGYEHAGNTDYSNNIQNGAASLSKSYDSNKPPTAAAQTAYDAALAKADELKKVSDGWSAAKPGVETKNPAYQPAKDAYDNACKAVKDFEKLKTTSEDKTVGTPGPTTKYYTNMYNRMKEGYAVEPDDNLKSAAWLNNQMQYNCLTLEKFGKDGKAADIDVSSSGELSKKTDDTDLARIKAKYDADLQAIQTKDKKLDLEIKQLDTEHSALQTEMESVQKVIQKNIENSFKTFG